MPLSTGKDLFLWMNEGGSSARLKNITCTHLDKTPRKDPPMGSVAEIGPDHHLL